jgi:hypothetical protein
MMGYLMKRELQIVVVPEIEVLFKRLPVCHEDTAVPRIPALSRLSSELTASTFD